MTDDVYTWQCETPGCKMRNSVQKDQIENALRKDLRPLLICFCCGYVYQFAKKGSGKGEDWVDCIPYLGTEKSLPSGRLPDGTFSDYQGKSHSRDAFIIKYGVDPERYLQWFDSGKPKCQL
jgi:hypothetical protein